MHRSISGLAVLLLPAVLALQPAPGRADDDFIRFRQGMLEPTRNSLQVEIAYRDCLAKAETKETYFTCRDTKDQELGLDFRAARTARNMQNPDAELEWNQTIKSLYLRVADQAIQGKKDTIYCLDNTAAMQEYEQCLLAARGRQTP